MTLKEATIIFALGFLGGLFLEFYRVYKLAQSNVFQFDKRFYIVSLLHAIAGGLISVPLAASLPWSAVFTGLSAPMIYSALAGRTFNEIYPVPRKWRAASEEMARNDTLNDISEDFLDYLEKSAGEEINKITLRGKWLEYVERQNKAFETRFGFEIDRARGSGLGFLNINLANYGYYLFGLFERPKVED